MGVSFRLQRDPHFSINLETGVIGYLIKIELLIVLSWKQQYG